MQVYLSLLLAVSVILIAVYFFLKKSIPVEPPIYFASVGISLVLSALLPSLIASFNLAGTLIAYFLFIILFALSLTFIWEKIVVKNARVSADPENIYVGKTVGDIDREMDQSASPADFAQILAEKLDRQPPGESTEDDVPDGESPDMPAALEEQDPGGLPPVPFEPENLEPEEERLPVAAEEFLFYAQAARAGGNYANALRHLYSASAMDVAPELKARLVLELGEVYRDCGQYWQTVEIVRAFLHSSELPQGEVFNMMLVNAAVCEAIMQLLEEAGQKPVPYAELPGELMEKAKKLAGKLILKGGW